MSDFMSNFNPAPFTNNSDHDVIIKSEGSSENLIKQRWSHSSEQEFLIFKWNLCL